MSQNLKEDTSISWVDLVLLEINSIFARAGSLEKAFLDIGPFSDWGVFIPDEDKRICSDYGECVIPFYKCFFSIIGIY